MRGQTRAIGEREAFPMDLAGNVSLAEAQEICCWAEGEL